MSQHTTTTVSQDTGSGTVRRGVLLGRLEAHTGDVVLSAPAGWGKSELLVQWLASPEEHVAWVPLDAPTDDPAFLWRRILAATWPITHRRDSGSTSRWRQGDLWANLLPTLHDELAALGVPVTLVLDDYHLVTDPASHQSIDLLLQRRPSNLRLVISTREKPPLSFGRLRVDGDLLELGAADLGFTLAETRRLLNDVLELGLSPEAVETLHDRTDGWPAGLHLAYLSLRGTADPDRFAGAFGGASRLVADYFGEVVLDTLDATQRVFVAATSILETMSASLCDAVTGRSDSAELLLEMHRLNLLVPLDDRGEWYRYHRLLGEFVEHELQRRDSQEVPKLHRCAAAWLETDGQIGGAVAHALAAGDIDRASRLVIENYLITIERGEFATVAGWLELFPHKVVAGDARLSIVEAWTMSFLHRREEARLAVENALRCDHDGPLPDGAGSVEASVALIGAGFPWGDVGEMLTAGRRAFELESREDSPWRATVHVQLGYALLFSGELDEARRMLERGAALALSTEHWLDAMGALCLLAWLFLDRGDLDEAQRTAQRGRELVEAHGLSETVPGGYAFATHGAVLAGQGRLDEGARLLDRGLDLMRLGIEPLLLIQCLLASASARLAQGSVSEAVALYDEATTLLEDYPDPGVLWDHHSEVGCGLGSFRHGTVDRMLSERELEVLRLFDKGLTKRQVAWEMYVSYNTIHTHTRSIYRKLGASSRGEALASARALGIL